MLLKKVEELTLYVIEQNRKVEGQRQQLDVLRALVEQQQRVNRVFEGYVEITREN